MEGLSSDEVVSRLRRGSVGFARSGWLKIGLVVIASLPNFPDSTSISRTLSRYPLTNPSSSSPIASLRGASQYRGVTKHHQHGKWEARIGRVDGSKYLYLGTFESAEEAARAYDRAAVKFRGRKVGRVNGWRRGGLGVVLEICSLGNLFSSRHFPFAVPPIQ